MKRGQRIGLVRSCEVTQAEQGQLHESIRKIRKASQDGVMTQTLMKALLVDGTQRKRQFIFISFQIDMMPS